MDTSIRLSSNDFRATRSIQRRRRGSRALRALLPIPMLLAALILGQPLYLIPGGAAWLNRQPEALAVAVVVIQTAGVLAVTLLLTALVCRYVQRRRLRDIGWVWTRSSPRTLTVGLAASLGTALPIGMLGTAASLGRDTASSRDLCGIAVVIVGLAMAFLLQGIPEELLFRGYLLDTHRDRPVLGAWLSSVIFAALHVFSNGGQRDWLEHVLYLTIPFGFGLLAAALALFTRSLWAAVGVHAGFHVSTLIGVPLGMQTSPTIWVAQGAVMAAFGAAVLARFRASEIPGSGPLLIK